MTTIYVETHQCQPHQLTQFTKSQLQFHNFTIHKFTNSQLTIHKVSGIFLHDNQVHKWDSTYMMTSWMKGSVRLHMRYSVKTFLFSLRLFLSVCFIAVAKGQ